MYIYALYVYVNKYDYYFMYIIPMIIYLSDQNGIVAKKKTRIFSAKRNSLRN